MSRRANSARSESRLKSTKPSPNNTISTKDKKKEKKRYIDRHILLLFFFNKNNLFFANIIFSL